MDSIEIFIKNNNLHNSEDIDSMLEFASLVRELTAGKQYSNINRIINYTVSQNYMEAFSWTMGILQEEFSKENCGLENFQCSLGGHIPNYDEFVQTLQVDFEPLKNNIEKVYDKNGEVSAFFNVIIYRTGFENVYLISSENFDTKDNDYIQYKLSFEKEAVL